VTDDYGRRQTFNTAIAASMELLNTTTKFLETNSSDSDKAVVQESLQTIILMLAPIVPHFCHVLWNHLGHEGAVMDANWPNVDESALVQDSVLIVLQVNGKLRDRIEVVKDLSKDDLEKKALENDAVKRFSDGKTLRKVIVVPGRLVNVVVS
jgi:leucyl-tRNA synthetase